MWFPAQITFAAIGLACLSTPLLWFKPLVSFLNDAWQGEQWPLATAQKLAALPDANVLVFATLSSSVAIEVADVQLVGLQASVNRTMPAGSP
jgi:hypothetical protein